MWEPQRVDSQIEQYARLWSKDEAARKRSSNLAETIKRVSHNMPLRWLFFPIDAGKVNAMAFVLFFNRNTSAIVFDAYVAAELFVIHSGNFNVNVDPIQHGTGDAFLVFGHNYRRARAGLERIAVISARAGVYTIE
jgi:hypothetical protein